MEHVLYDPTPHSFRFGSVFHRHLVHVLSPWRTWTTPIYWHSASHCPQSARAAGSSLFGQMFAAHYIRGRRFVSVYVQCKTTTSRSEAPSCLDPTDAAKTRVGINQDNSSWICRRAGSGSFSNLSFCLWPQSGSDTGRALWSDTWISLFGVCCGGGCRGEGL